MKHPAGGASGEGIDPSSVTIRFALLFGLIAGGLLIVYALPFELLGLSQDPLEGYLRLFARCAGGVLAWLDPSVCVQGTRIEGRFPLRIVRNCDASEIYILFVAATLALPAPLGSKLMRAISGLAVLISANVLRICALYFIGANFSEWFKVFHEEIFPLVLVALAAGLFARQGRLLLGSQNVVEL